MSQFLCKLRHNLAKVKLKIMHLAGIILKKTKIGLKRIEREFYQSMCFNYENFVGQFTLEMQIILHNLTL